MRRNCHHCNFPLDKVAVREVRLTAFYCVVDDDFGEDSIENNLLRPQLELRFTHEYCGLDLHPKDLKWIEALLAKKSGRAQKKKENVHHFSKKVV